MIYYSMDEFPCGVDICNICNKKDMLYIIHMNSFPYSKGVKCDSIPSTTGHPIICSKKCFEYFKLLSC